ncbi:hypothetical protein COU60_04405 [Candidatus Pacearchaeota archaeon CG10_big_fil_rev_8_21_14_0_10_34_76]|nr:MAG: hypothetical protein COU60_04405 [Candidatus Pacearchaeota archaeon CG10_big_fil_rev_8_21_14_0_10_34_76]
MATGDRVLPNEPLQPYDDPRHEHLFCLGDNGVRFTRPGDRVFYTEHHDSFKVPYAEAIIIKKDSPQTAIDTSLRRGERIVSVNSAETRPLIRLLTPYYGMEGSGRDFNVGNVLVVEPNELYWDREKPFPADRIKDYVSFQALAYRRSLESRGI